MGSLVEVIRVDSESVPDGISEDQIGAGVAGPSLGQAPAEPGDRAGLAPGGHQGQDDAQELGVGGVGVAGLHEDLTDQVVHPAVGALVAGIGTDFPGEGDGVCWRQACG